MQPTEFNMHRQFNMLFWDTIILYEININFDVSQIFQKSDFKLAPKSFQQ